VTGVIHWPTELYREALRAILSAPHDAALGFVNARSRRAAVTLDKVDRQNLIRGGAALGVGTLVMGPLAALLEGLEGSEPTPTPTRISATDIEQIRVAKQVFQFWSLTYGGGSARDAVMGELRWAAGLLKAICPDELHPELHSAIGDLAATAGFIAMDAGANASGPPSVPLGTVLRRSGQGLAPARHSPDGYGGAGDRDRTA
jgi:hypothetical protein